MEKKKKIKRKANRRGGKPPSISDNMADEMFILYLNSVTLGDIAKKYKCTIRVVQKARDRNKWVERKKKIKDSVSRYVDKKLIDTFIHNKNKQLEIMAMILDNLYKDIREDHENKGKKGYKIKVDVGSITEVEKAFKTIYMVMNQGVDKSENTENKSVHFTISKEDQKMLLQAMADGRVDVIKGNA